MSDVEIVERRRESSSFTAGEIRELHAKLSAAETRATSLRIALSQLAKEAYDFQIGFDPFTHGRTNQAVLRLRIDEALALLAKEPA